MYMYFCQIECNELIVFLTIKEYNVDFLIFEKSDDIAGLWRFREDGYGVMSFTHINVSKYNYCFSDFPYPDDTVEFMHHKHIYDYTKAYINENKFFDRIRFDHQVVSVEGSFFRFISL
jgi:dimethylaniline monooxygenase (N-oxide forming)